MIYRKRLLLTAVLLIFCIAGSQRFAQAELIVFKSGKFISGTIVEKKDKFIKVDVYGVILTYYLDEIKIIFERRPSLIYADALKDAIAARFEVAREKLLQTAEVAPLRDLSLVILKVMDDAGKGLISQEGAVHFFKGMSYGSEQKTAESIQEFKQAIEISPEYEVFYIYLAVTYIGDDKLQEAVGAFQKALAVNPDSPEANHFLGALYVHLDKRDEGIPYLQKAIELYQKNENLEKAELVKEFLKKIQD